MDNTLNFTGFKNPTVLSGTIAVDSLNKPVQQAVIPPAATVPPTVVPTLQSAGFTNPTVLTGTPNNQTNTGTASATNDGSTLPKWAQNLLDTIKPQTSSVSDYEAAQKAAGIEAAQAQANKTQQELSTISAEAQAIIDAGTQQKLALTGQGRGITTGILGGQAAQIDRQTAIKALPLQAQALAKQAQLTGDQAALKMAQDKLDTVFRLKSEDATRNYNYQIKVFDTLMEVAKEEQRNALQARKDEITTNLSKYTNALNNGQQISRDAYSNGNFDVAAAITKLVAPDPSSKTFAQDLLNYNNQLAQFQSQITPKAKTTEPLSILDIDRYQTLYPEAGILAGDTAAVANQKVAALNTPEAKTRALIVAAKDANNDYQTVIKEINSDPSITDKALAKKIADEVYGKNQTIAQRFAGQELRSANTPGISNDIYQFLFSNN